MRIIKFIITVVRKNGYVFSSNQFALADFEDGTVAAWKKSNSAMDEECNHYRQFTGLKDKNGKEIYEGDIVAIKYDTRIEEDENGEPTPERKPAIGFVDWNEHATGWIIRVNVSTEYLLTKWTKGFMTSITHGECGEREIIGNIYSNPELIK